MHWKDFFLGLLLAAFVAASTASVVKTERLLEAIQAGVLVRDGKAYSLDEMGGRE